MYSEEHRAELIEEIFAAFAWRQKPDKIWRTNVWEGKELERHVERVDPRDFTFELMDRHVQLRMYCEFIHFFTTQGFQYYLPSLMSLLLKDLFRSDGLVEVLIHTLHRIAHSIIRSNDGRARLKNSCPKKKYNNNRSGMATT